MDEEEVKEEKKKMAAAGGLWLLVHLATLLQSEYLCHKSCIGGEEEEVER